VVVVVNSTIGPDEFQYWLW
ncbi:unnamed protein product, partial [Rotaria magnacalcarata]